MSEHRKIGFTGTQLGMTDKQCFGVVALLELFNYGEHDDPIDEVHHGMCIGADAQFHDIVRGIDPQIKIIGHPIDSIKQAKLECDIVRPVKRPLARNRDIVIECDLIIATPHTAQEVQRSGTWSTVRYARQRNKDVRIFEP
jgi:hypothetical protein